MQNLGYTLHSTLEKQDILVEFKLYNPYEEKLYIV